MLSIIQIELKAFIAEQKRSLSRFAVSATILALCLSITFIFSAVIETLAKRSEFKLPSGSDVYTLTLLSDDDKQIQLSPKAIRHIKDLSFESLEGIVALNNVQVPINHKTHKLSANAQVLHFDIFKSLISEQFTVQAQINQVILSQAFSQQLSELFGSPVTPGTSIKLRDTLFKVTAIAPSTFTGLGVDQKTDIWLPYQNLTFAFGLPPSANRDGLFEVPNTQLYAISKAQHSEVTAEVFWLEQVLASESLLPTGTTLTAIKGIQPNFNQFKNASELSWLNLSGSMVLLMLGLISFFRFRLMQLNNNLNTFVTKIALGQNEQMIFVTLLAQTFVSLVIVFALAIVFAALSQQAILAQMALGIDKLPHAGFLKYLIWSIPAALVLSFIQLKALRPALKNNIAVRNTAHTKVTAMLVNGLISATFISLLLFLLMMLQKFQHYEQTPYGYQADNIIVIPLKRTDSTQSTQLPDHQVFKSQLTDKAKQLGLNAAFASSAPMSGEEMGMINYFIPSSLSNGHDKSSINVNHVSANFFKQLDIELKQGQLFEGAGASVVVNQSFVNQYFNGDISLPTTIYIAGFKPGTNEAMRIARHIVGVVEDYFPNSKKEVIQPIIFAAIEDVRTIHYVLLSGQVNHLSNLNDQLFSKQISHQPQTPYVLAQKIKQDTMEEAARLSIFVIVTLLSMFIFLIGVYTQLAQQMDSQRREIAIRFAIGATNSDIFLLAIKSATITFLPGALVAILGFTLLSLGQPAWLQVLEPRLSMILAATIIFTLLVTLSTFFVYRANRESDVASNLFSQQ